MIYTDNIGNMDNSSNTQDKRQALQDMCRGQMPEGTMQPIKGSNEWRLFLRNGMTMTGTKEFLREMWQILSAGAL
jgi:hypothetical protein